MNELQFIATSVVFYRPSGRGQGFRTARIERGTRLPGDHPAVQQRPENFMPANAADLRKTVHIGFLPKEDV